MLACLLVMKAIFTIVPGFPAVVSTGCSLKYCSTSARVKAGIVHPLKHKIVFEAFTCPVYRGLTIAIDRHRPLPVDAPAGLAASIAIIQHTCLFIDTEQHCIGQVCRHLLCPAFAEGIVVGSD